jgi:HSP20 family protein
MKIFGQEQDVRISLSDLQDELNSLFGRLYHGGLVTRPLDGQDWAPRIDLIEEPDQYILRAEVPGVPLDEIEVSALSTRVTIKGQKPAPAMTPGTGRLIFGETPAGSFCREVALPAEVKPEEVSAQGADGVLVLTLPKAEAARRVSVDVRPG